LGIVERAFDHEGIGPALLRRYLEEAGLGNGLGFGAGDASFSGQLRQSGLVAHLQLSFIGQEQADSRFTQFTGQGDQTGQLGIQTGNQGVEVFLRMDVQQAVTQGLLPRRGVGEQVGRVAKLVVEAWIQGIVA